MPGRIIKAVLLASITLIMPGCVVFEIRDELQKANQNLATANTQLMAANTELDIANAKLIEANSRLVQANRDLTVVNNNLAQTIQRLDGTNGQIATLQEKHLTSLDGRLDPLGKSLGEVDVHLASLRKTLDNIDSMIPFLNVTDSATDEPASATPLGTVDPANGQPAPPATTDPHSAPTPATSPTPSSSTIASPNPGSTSSGTRPAEKSTRMLPESIQIDGREFRLHVYMWRNFQPGVGQPADNRGLLAKVNLVPSDKGSAPKGVDAVAVRLQRGKSVWTGTASKEAGDTPDTWERMIRSGPAWDMGADVNVFVQLQFPDGSKKWLAAYNQKIDRVD